MFGHFTTLCMKGLNAELLSCNSFLSGVADWGLAVSEKMTKSTVFCGQVE